MNSLIEIHSFGNSERIRTEIVKPDSYDDLVALIQKTKKIIPSGQGLSYRLSFAGTGSTAINCLLFNKIISFDPGEGIICVEAGLSIGNLLAFLSYRGYWIPVIPGHPGITIGACVASNVHGKSHYKHGNFCSYVQSLKLYHPLHGFIECSAHNNHDVFNLTCGGYGMTGFIVTVTLRILNLPGKEVELNTIPLENLTDGASNLLKFRDEYDFMYTWHDLSTFDNGFGKGFFFGGRYTKEDILKDTKIRNWKPPRRYLINMYSPKLMQVINKVYYRYKFHSSQGQPEKLPLSKGWFPIRNHYYYQMLGRRGFSEHQFLIPHQSFSDFITELSSYIQCENHLISLCSLKLFDGQKRALDFTGKGISMVVQLPVYQGKDKFDKKLQELLQKYEGIVNISKNKFYESNVVKNLFDSYEQVRSDLSHYDPEKVCSSNLREQLKL